MALTDNTVRMETAPPGTDKVRTQLTGASSTFVPRLSKVLGFAFSVEGTNSCTATISGNTITFTGTNEDFVNIDAWGLQ